LSVDTKPSIFISDLHLSEEAPDLTRLFLHFLEKIAPLAGALYILGDLFEVWLGDDDTRALARVVQKHLHNLAQDGVKIYLMRGNRDIMMGERFASLCGATLLSDPTLIDLYGIPTLLMHGDSLCTLDKKHQRYRRLTLNPIVRFLFLHSPLWFRRKIAFYLRNKSKKYQSSKKIDQLILDVDQEAVTQLLAQYKATQLIHGHTHKPQIHHIACLNELERPGTRCVLGDWGPLGNMLVCTPVSLELQSFSSSA